MIKFALKVVILGAVFYGLTYFDVLSGLDIVPNEDGPLGEYGTYLWIGLIFGVVNAALLGLTAAITDRLTIDGFVTAVLGGLILAVAGWAADQVLDR